MRKPRKPWKQEYTPELQAQKKERYRRNRLLVASLKEEKGNACERCRGAGRLEFDHIDPSTKIFSLGQACLRSEKSIRAEAAKCRLLCRKCHWKRTSKQHADGHMPSARIFDPPTGVLQRCNRCLDTKDICEFNKDSRGGRQTVCKDCVRVRRQTIHRSNAEYIESKKKLCIECGVTEGLEFDHVRGKKFRGVAMMKSFARHRIDEEIAKCDVVCTECHMQRTEERPSSGGRPRKAGVAERQTQST